MNCGMRCALMTYRNAHFVCSIRNAYSGGALRRKPRAVVYENERGETESVEQNTPKVDMATANPMVKRALERTNLSDDHVITSPRKPVVRRNLGITDKQIIRNTGGKGNRDDNEQFAELDYLNEIHRLFEIKHRREDGKILIEGRRLILEALQAQCHIHKLFFTNNDVIEGLDKIEADKMIRVSPRFWKRGSKMVAPPGIMAIASSPTYEDLKASYSPIPLTVILDSIDDPGNLGSIIRSLAAVNCHSVVIASRCCDPWGWKVMRGAMGAHFHIPVVSGVPMHSIKAHLPPNSKLYVATNSLKDAASNDFSYLSGVSDLWDVDLKSKQNSEHCVLLVGGETKGLGKEGRKLAEELQATGIYIPMNEKVESLNITTAVSLIAYEMFRQMR